MSKSADLSRVAHRHRGFDTRTRLRVVATLLGIGSLLVVTQQAIAHQDPNSWAQGSEAKTSSNLAEDQSPNPCEGVAGIPFGTDPGWVRVGGSTSPSHPFVEARGQVLETQNAPFKPNPFITHTDNPVNHYSKDINVFLALDPPYRHLLANPGSFVEGEENEHGMFEVEWERGGLPIFAFPSTGDRMTVWGPHIFDCGHGDHFQNIKPWTWIGPDPDQYRTEIHPPVGWVVYRNTAHLSAFNPGDKRTQDPWIWYESNDRQGTGGRLPSTGLLQTPVRSTMADAFFSSFGGNVPESLNGCDTDGVDCTQENEWRQSLLNQDYSFFVPAPEKPAAHPIAGQPLMVWDVEDRCGEIPHSPGNPPGDDIEEVGEADDTAENIGAPTCTIPETIEPTVENGQPGIRVTVLAKSSGISYPGNNYIAYAKRFKVAWDHVPGGSSFGQGEVHTYRVDVKTLRVYDDSDPCGEDGEWVMSITLNEQWIHPVRGSGDDGDPFWEDEAIDDDKCIVGHDPGFRSYAIGESKTLDVAPGQGIQVLERTYDHDTIANDLLRFSRKVHFAPGTNLVQGDTDHDIEGAHTIVYDIIDVTKPYPTPGTLTVGSPSYGPNADTGGAQRVAATTPITLDGSNAAKLEFRKWLEGTTKPAMWQFDITSPLGVSLAGWPDGTYIVEYAPVSGEDLVGPRRATKIQYDATPPTLTVPADMEVRATEAAGTNVTFAVSATDSLPGPVTTTCDKESGSFFPVRQVTTVTCKATDSVGNSTTKSFTVEVVSPFGYIPDFVALSRQWTQLDTGVLVDSGNIGTFDRSAGPVTHEGYEVVIGSTGSLVGGPSQIAGASVFLGNFVAAGEVFDVEGISAGSGTGYVDEQGYVPLFLGMPLFPAFTAGGNAVTVTGTRTLAPGSYGFLSVEPKSRLTLTGGDYYFTGIRVHPNATLEAAAPVNVHVTGRLRLGHGSRLAPATGGTVTPHELKVWVAGTDDPLTPPTAIRTDDAATVHANLYAPNGTVQLGPRTDGKGAFLGLRLYVGEYSRLALDSTFDYP